MVFLIKISDKGRVFMTINERIRKLRRHLDLTQKEFAAQIGTTQNSLTGYERGRRTPSGSVVNNICKTFNVNEAWLREGTGDMFTPAIVSDEISALVDKTLQGVPDNIRQRFLTALAVLSDDDLKAVERFALALIGGDKNGEK